jgi:hypothetical protein
VPTLKNAYVATPAISSAIPTGMVPSGSGVRGRVGISADDTSKRV